MKRGERKKKGIAQAQFTGTIPPLFFFINFINSPRLACPAKPLEEERKEVMCYSLYMYVHTIL